MAAEWEITFQDLRLSSHRLGTAGQDTTPDGDIREVKVAVTTPIRAGPRAAAIAPLFVTTQIQVANTRGHSSRVPCRRPVYSISQPCPSGHPCPTLAVNPFNPPSANLRSVRPHGALGRATSEASQHAPPRRARPRYRLRYHYTLCSQSLNC